MDSRTRVISTINRKEPDRVPIDFGGTAVSTICYQAYNDLIDYLGFNCEKYYPKDLGAGAWAGVVPPENIIALFDTAYVFGKY